MSIEKSHYVWLFFAISLALFAYSFGKKQSSNKIAFSNNEVKNNSSNQPKLDAIRFTNNSDQKPVMSAPKVLKEKKPQLKTLLKSDLLMGVKNLPAKDKIDKFIEEAKLEEIDFYLNQYFSNDILAEVSDKRFFSKRLLQEYSNVENTQTQSPHGSIFFSLKSQIPVEVTNSFSVDYKQQMYAHLRFDGSLANKGDVFVRWIRLADNKIMLFERKKINSQSQENWVSLMPSKDWQIGVYLVTFYSFNSKLTVLAQDSYNIDSVGTN